MNPVETRNKIDAILNEGTLDLQTVEYVAKVLALFVGFVGGFAALGITVFELCMRAEDAIKKGISPEKFAEMLKSPKR